jgi:hypothetical protein
VRVMNLREDDVVSAVALVMEASEDATAAPVLEPPEDEDGPSGADGATPAAEAESGSDTDTEE